MNSSIFFFFSILLIGCHERKNSLESNSNPQMIDSVSPQNDFIDFEVPKLSDEIYEEAQLDDQWDDLMDVEESVLDLIGLDSKAADTYLIEIDEDLESMEDETFPERFETQSIRSRLALTRAFAQKAVFYTRSYDADSLDIALAQFFNAYNALIARIESTHIEAMRKTKDSLLFRELDSKSLDSLNPMLIHDTLQID